MGTVKSPWLPLARRPSRFMVSTCSGHMSTMVTSLPARARKAPT